MGNKAQQKVLTDAQKAQMDNNETESSSGSDIQVKEEELPIICLGEKEPLDWKPRKRRQRQETSQTDFDAESKIIKRVCREDEK